MVVFNSCNLSDKKVKIGDKIIIVMYPLNMRIKKEKIF